MSIATNLQKLETDITNAYSMINTKGGTIPSNKNTNNLATAINSISGKTVSSWHQCPELVRNYLSNVTYSPSDYTVSYIDNYAPRSAVETNRRPIGNTIDGVTYYNEVPNVQTPFSSANASGTLQPLDNVRWIKNECIDNFRDLGGWSCDGGTIKYGKLFRGTRLIATTEIEQLLNELNIAAELDLRNSEEIEIYPDTLKDYVDYFNLSGVWYTLNSPDKWKQHIKFIFDNVNKNKNVYFHCMGGLDRTGSLACIIEGLLGVSQSDIDKDYEMGCFYSGTATDNNARRRNEADWTGLISEITQITGSTFRDKCVNFVASLGFTMQEINLFRQNMIDGTPSTVTPTITTYTITKNLTDTSLDNSISSIQKNQEYTTKVLANDDFLLNNVSITMGGTNITGTNYNTIIVGGMEKETFPYYGEINIPMVTGNLVVTASSKSSARLPDAYQEVSWIGANSNNYTTCIKPNLTWAEIDEIQFKGYRDDWDNYSGASGIMLLATWTAAEGRTSPYVAIRDNFSFSGVTGSVDNNYSKTQVRESNFKEFTVSFNGNTSSGQVCFGSWTDPGYGSRWKSREQIWSKNSTVLRHLIPCYLKTNSSRIGMYDIINDVFYENAGGGTLVKGTNV